MCHEESPAEDGDETLDHRGAGRRPSALTAQLQTLYTVDQEALGVLTNQGPSRKHVVFWRTHKPFCAEQRFLTPYRRQKTCFTNNLFQNTYSLPHGEGLLILYIYFLVTDNLFEWLFV
jgi:hypothetical protein